MKLFFNPLHTALIVLSLIVTFSPAHASSVQDLEQWSDVTLDVHATPKLRIFTQAQPRIGSNLSHSDRLYLKTAVGYQVTKSMSIWQGLGWTPTFEGVNTLKHTFPEHYTDEHILYQQVLFENKWKNLKINNRSILEERFIERAGGTNIRARHLLKLAYPIGKSKKWSLVAFDDLYMNLNSTPRGPKAGFDQNLLFFGINRKLTPHIALEAGYMNNPVNVFHHSVNRMNHAALVSLNFKF